MRQALSAPSLAQHLKSVSDINPIYSALRDAAVTEAKLPNGGSSARYAANLERARSIPAKGKFVLVDAATARLWMYQDGRPVDSMKVIVGKLDYRTPMVASVIWYTTLQSLLARARSSGRSRPSPSECRRRARPISSRMATRSLPTMATMPRSFPPCSVDWKAVAAGTGQDQDAPAAGADQLDGQDEVQLRQPRGNLPPRHADQGLFRQSNRALSNGCIRLEDAKRLGRWLLGREPVAAVGRRGAACPAAAGHSGVRDIPDGAAAHRRAGAGSRRLWLGYTRRFGQDCRGQGCRRGIVEPGFAGLGSLLLSSQERRPVPRTGLFLLAVALRCQVHAQATPDCWLVAGEPCWIRTSDLLIKSQLLYQLS